MKATSPSLEQRFVDAGLEDRAIGGGLSQADRSKFNALAVAARELEQSDFSKFEMDVAQDAIFAALDATDDAPAAPTVPDTSPSIRRARLGLVAAILVGGLSAVVWSTLPNDEEFSVRSAALPPTDTLARVEAFCVTREAGELRFTGAAESPFGVLRCSQSDDLKFAYRLDTSGYQYLYVGGIAPDGSTTWYGPGVGDAYHVSPQAELAPIGETRRLAVNHVPGTYTLVGVFSESPLARDEFERILGMVKSGGDANTAGRHVSRSVFEVVE